MKKTISQSTENVQAKYRVMRIATILDVENVSPLSKKSSIIITSLNHFHYKKISAIRKTILNS